jgi:hypothetical protein
MQAVHVVDHDTIPSSLPFLTAHPDA